MEEKSLPIFDAAAAEEYISQLLQDARRIRTEIFERHNEGRHASEYISSPESREWLGREKALMDVLRYFKNFDIGTPREESGMRIVAYIRIHYYDDESMSFGANGTGEEKILLICSGIMQLAASSGISPIVLAEAVLNTVKEAEIEVGD